MNSMCLESWGRSSYARILIEIDICNGFSGNLVIAVNLDRPRYTKETIFVEYEWKHPHCSTCLIFGHLVDDCPKALKLMVNRVDKDKCGSSGANDDGFIEVIKKKSGGNNGGTKRVELCPSSYTSDIKVLSPESTSAASNELLREKVALPDVESFVLLVFFEESPVVETFFLSAEGAVLGLAYSVD
nr:hypothetical protein [Tanacetum cinerariifolium]